MLGVRRLSRTTAVPSEIEDCGIQPMPTIITRDHLTASQGEKSRKFWGIITRKQRWGLSWRGWLILVALAFASVFLLFLNVQPFLSVTHRVSTDILVVEGWIPTYAIRTSVEGSRLGPISASLSPADLWKEMAGTLTITIPRPVSGKKL